MKPRNYDADTEEVIKILTKRRNVYTIITAVIIVVGGFCGAIPTVGPIISGVAMIVWGIFAGYGILAINHLRYVKSGGRKQGGGLWWFLLILFGLIVIPFLTVVITNRIQPLAERVLGVKFI